MANRQTVEEMQMQDQTAMLLTDINIKLRDIEEKQNIIKDRVLLIGENFISEKESTDQEISVMKNRIKMNEEEIRKLRAIIQRMVEDQNIFARKSEVEILERQFQMFQPLELARLVDVKEMIQKVLAAKKD